MVIQRLQSRKGFTLIELLITIAIIGIIAVVSFVVLDPGTRFEDSRDAARWTDVTAILDAIKLNQVDSRGQYLSAIANATADRNYMIGTASSGCNVTCDATIAADGAACISLAGLTTPTSYLVSVPISPQETGGTAWDATKTGYYFNRSSAVGGGVTVGACSGENATISVAR